MIRKMETVAADLFKDVEIGTISGICAALVLQLEFIDVLLHGAAQIQMMTQQWTDSPQRDDLKVHLDDFSGLLSRTLEEALEISNPLLASHSTQVKDTLILLTAYHGDNRYTFFCRKTYFCSDST